MEINNRHVVAFVLIAFLLASTFGTTALTNQWELLNSNVTTLSTSSFSGMEIYTGNGRSELTFLRGCSVGQITKFATGGAWACADDSTSAATGTGAVALDIGDNGADESTEIVRINSAGDTGGCFAESTPDELTVTISACAVATAAALAANGANCAAASFPLGVDAAGAVEGCSTSISGNAATATALAANPADCAADTKADAIAASGALSCSAVDTGDITNGTILEEDLNAIDAAGDEECLTFETPGFEWQSCGAAAANSFETMNVGTGTDPVADSSTDTLNLNDSITISVTGDAATDSLSWHIIADYEEEAEIGTTAVTGSAVDDSFIIGSGASTAAWSAALADCNTNNRDRIQYDAATNTLSCDTDTLGTADVAGLDIGDDTNLTCGRSLTLSGDGCDADAELYTHTKSINILDPTTGETNQIQFYFPLASTFARVACSVDTGTLTIQFDERAEATPNTAGTNVLTAALVCDTDSQTTTAFDNAAIAADVPVNLQITGASGTPNVVRIHIEYTADE